VSFQRTKSLIGGGASKGVTHPTAHSFAKGNENNGLIEGKDRRLTLETVGTGLMEIGKRVPRG